MSNKWIFLGRLQMMVGKDEKFLLKRVDVKLYIRKKVKIWNDFQYLLMIEESLTKTNPYKIVYPLLKLSIGHSSVLTTSRHLKPLLTKVWWPSRPEFLLRVKKYDKLLLSELSPHEVHWTPSKAIFHLLWKVFF